MSCAAPHPQQGQYIYVQFILSVVPGNLDFGASQSCQPGRAVTGFGSESFQVTMSSWENDTIFCSTGRTTESRPENRVDGVKKTCFVLHPSLQNVPIGVSGGFTPRKKQLGAFPAVVGLPELPGSWTCLNGDVSLVVYLSNC